MPVEFYFEEGWTQDMQCEISIVHQSLQSNNCYLPCFLLTMGTFNMWSNRTRTCLDENCRYQAAHQLLSKVTTFPSFTLSG